MIERSSSAKAARIVTNTLDPPQKPMPPVQPALGVNKGRGVAYSFFARTQELNESKVIARLLARSVALMVFCHSDSKTCPTRRLDGPDSLIRTLSPNTPGQIAFYARDLFRGIALSTLPQSAGVTICPDFI